MPQGSVLQADGPNHQHKLGQILSTNGKIYPFFNIVNLKVNDPVIFEIKQGKVTVNEFNGTLAIGVLPNNYDNIENETGNWTDPSLKIRWEKEWKTVSEIQLKSVNLDRDKINNYKRYKKPN